MSFAKLGPGAQAPATINVVIEIPAHSDPVKYEVDKDSGAVFVDRFMSTAMHYPCNYGYVPGSLAEDGDPLDVLVPTPFALIPGTIIEARPVGVLQMTDEAGGDAKVLAVPIDKLTPIYRSVRSPEDMALVVEQIAHFFAHYKDLEPGKWVKVDGWGAVEQARKEILDSIARYHAHEATTSDQLAI